MQNVTARINTPTGTRTLKFKVDENVGLAAGLDQYATARGTAKKLARQLNPFPWVMVTITVDNEYTVKMSIENKKWIAE